MVEGTGSWRRMAGSLLSDRLNFLDLEAATKTGEPLPAWLSPTPMTAIGWFGTTEQVFPLGTHPIFEAASPN